MQQQQQQQQQQAQAEAAAARRAEKRAYGEQVSLMLWQLTDAAAAAAAQQAVEVLRNKGDPGLQGSIALLQGALDIMPAVQQARQLMADGGAGNVEDWRAAAAMLQGAAQGLAAARAAAAAAGGGEVGGIRAAAAAAGRPDRDSLRSSDGGMYFMHPCRCSQQ
jgi:hypothetical protein